MEHGTTSGLNRTGCDMSPMASHSMQDFAEAQSPEPADTPESLAIATLRSIYATDAESIGSIPLPATLAGTVASGIAHLTGHRPEVLMDKLGERLAFERSGVRLYQALIDKAQSISGSGPLPCPLGELEHIRDEELQHMHWVDEAIQALGADPTAQTPCADIAGVATSGIMQVLTDPRTTMAQCLNALLTAELADEAGWELLIRLTEDAGRNDLLDNFRVAQEHEHEHMTKVRDWLTREVLAAA